MVYGPKAYVEGRVGKKSHPIILETVIILFIRNGNFERKAPSFSQWADKYFPLKMGYFQA